MDALCPSALYPGKQMDGRRLTVFSGCCECKPDELITVVYERKVTEIMSSRMRSGKYGFQVIALDCL
jgi:hypothetical protein